MIIKPGDRVISIDPGLTTGIATWVLNGIEDTEQDKFTHKQFVQLLSAYKPTIIICESFEHTMKDNTDYSPVEFIGLVKWYIEATNCSAYWQTPGFGKGYFTNDKLKKLGLYRAARGHGMDALRHLLQWRMKHNLFDLTLLKDEDMYESDQAERKRPNIRIK